MGLAAEITPHLPYLRRFSRALTGSQNSGDAYVAAVLETLILDATKLEQAPNVRTALYATYCRLWESVSINMRNPGEGPEWEKSARRHLQGIAPQAREAYLLMAIEGFSRDEISIILNRDSDIVGTLIDEAIEEIFNQVTTDILIIEDEPLIAMDIEALMESLGHTVTGIARTEEEALLLASKHRPGLVLADIQLADGSSGIDAVNGILQNFEVPVIFITAFPERLLTGVRPEPAFLITKPFMPEMVKAVVSQALFFEAKAKAAA